MAPVLVSPCQRHYRRRQPPPGEFPMPLSRRTLLGSTAALGVAQCWLDSARAATPGLPNSGVNQLFDGLVEAILQDSPESATFLGLDKGKRANLKSRLSDQSWAHAAE